MPVELKVEQMELETAVVTLTGALTLGTGLKVADSQLQGLIAKGTTKLVLDMTLVPYMDSAGLGMLVHTFGLAEEKGGALRLAGATDRVTALLKMTRTLAILPVDESVAGSLAELAKGATA